MTRQTLAISCARTRGGRALLHALCLARGRHVGWHVRGIVRELFGRVAGSRLEAGDETPTESTRTRSCVGRGHGRTRTLLTLLVLAITEIGASLAVWADGPAHSLLPSVQVDSTGIFLHQIAAVTGADSTTASVRLAAAPVFGRAVILTRQQIVAALQAVRPDLLPATWNGAESVRVIRRSRLLAESEFRDLLTTTLQAESVKDRGELELRLARPWTAVPVPDEPLALKVLDLPSTGVSQHFVVRFELAIGDDRLGPWQAVAQAKVMKNVIVAAATVRRGQTLDTAEVTVERRDILSLREPVEDTALRNGSFEFIENVAAGQPVLARSIRPRPVVQRGMMVDGLVRDGSIQISLKVEVLADALPGQMVRVRNPKTRREFYAKVKDEQTVLINL